MEEKSIIFADRELPYSKEAEEGVIGCILYDGKCIAAAAEIVKPDDFFLAPARAVYSAALELFNSNEPIDFVSVAALLSKKDKLEAIGGSTYLAGLASSVSTSEHTAYYCDIIKQKSVSRSLIKAASSICADAYADADDINKLLEQAEQKIYDVSASRERSDIVHVGDVVMDAYNVMVENAMSTGHIDGLDTGFEALNYKTGGFHGGELILVAGRPAMGKSSFAVNIAEYVAFQTGKTVAIFNLEMPKLQIVNRIMCSQAKIDARKIKTGEIDAEDWIRIGRSMNKFYRAPMYIDDTSTITVSEIRAKCRRLKQAKNLQMVVIDYLQLMQSPRRTDNRQQEIADITRSLKILAKELDVPVIALSQLSRTVESRSDKRPMLSDLRESGAIEQDADVVMFLYRDEYYNKESTERGIAECIIAKQRGGETGTIKLGWQGSFTKFLNLENNENYNGNKDTENNKG